MAANKLLSDNQLCKHSVLSLHLVFYLIKALLYCSTIHHQLLINLLTQLNPLEVLGMLSGVVYVVLAARENVWCWLPGLVNVLATALVCYNYQLYADAGLQLVYVALTFYGWQQWLYGGTNAQILQISQTSTQQWQIYGAIIALLTAILWLLLRAYTPSNVPFADAFTTTLSLIATYMTARKQLQNWLLWIFTDILYIGLYAYKQLPLFALLSVVYTVVAWQGYVKWKKSYTNIQAIK